jgi:hypothetical protein
MNQTENPFLDEYGYEAMYIWEEINGPAKEDDDEMSSLQQTT